jgi:hypothetical protein|tara:strand:- start:738 stop:926 length:189 start_codon:yes stop_codon:yes gene_type:complete
MTSTGNSRGEGVRLTVIFRPWEYAYIDREYRSRILRGEKVSRSSVARERVLDSYNILSESND